MFFLQDCEDKLGYSFKDKELVRLAFTHKSYAYEQGGGDNERLEFLGDSVLGYIVSEYLYKKNSAEREGSLTEAKQNLVSTAPLCEAVIRAGLDKFLLVGDSISNKPSRALYENLFEAITAAIYLDGGIAPCKSFVEKFLLSESQSEKIINSKCELQIFAQKKKLGTPTYETVTKSGPDHDPLFTVSVSIGGKIMAVGSGKNKSEASKNAAARALKKLTGRK